MKPVDGTQITQAARMEAGALFTTIRLKFCAVPAISVPSAFCSHNPVNGTQITRTKWVVTDIVFTKTRTTWTNTNSIFIDQVLLYHGFPIESASSAFYTTDTASGTCQITRRATDTASGTNQITRRVNSTAAGTDQIARRADSPTVRADQIVWFADNTNHVFNKINSFHINQ